LHELFELPKPDCGQVLKVNGHGCTRVLDRVLRELVGHSLKVRQLGKNLDDLKLLACQHPKIFHRIQSLIYLVLTHKGGHHPLSEHSLAELSTRSFNLIEQGSRRP
jgi:hypothetical protein